MSHAGLVRGLANWDLRHIGSNKTIPITLRSAMQPWRRKSCQRFVALIQIADHTGDLKLACVKTRFALMVLT